MLGAQEQPRDTTRARASAGPPALEYAGSPGFGLSPVGVPRDKGRKASVLVAPIPFYNSQLGAGLVGVAGVLKRIGSDRAPPSSVGLFGVATTNGTWGAGVGGMAHFGDDDWRLLAGGGYMDMRFSYYGIGGASDVPVGLRLKIAPLRVQGLRQVVKNLYLGGQVQYSRVSIGLDVDSAAFDVPFVPDPRTFTEVIVAPVVEFDSRNDQFFPTRGWLVDASASLLSAKLGSDSTMQRYDVLTTWQTGWDDGTQVVAASVLGCYATGEVPINQLCLVSGQNGLRGYEPGRYLDRTMVTVQAEYRKMVGRFGFTAFAGVAQTAPRPADLSTEDLLPAAGVGLRFRLLKQFPINYRTDVAFGKDGVEFYFSIGEGF